MPDKGSENEIVGPLEKEQMLLTTELSITLVPLYIIFKLKSCGDVNTLYSEMSLQSL